MTYETINRAFDAVYFDGRSARAHPVTGLFGVDGSLRLSWADGQAKVFPAGSFSVSARLGDAPRSIALPDDQRCETNDNDAVDAAMDALGSGRGAAWRHGMERNLKAIALGVVVVGVAVLLVIRFGLPEAAKRIAYALPIEVNEQIGREALETLDKMVFKPSELTKRRQAELRLLFRRYLEQNADSYPYQLEFRSSPGLGANALALPSGVIVVTDGLLELAKNDDEIVAVLAHECGHIQGRHGLRTVLQNSAVVVLFAVITGDMSGVTAVGATMLLQSKFSRDFEEEADAFAVRTLPKAAIEPAALADILERLEKSRPEGEFSDAKVLDYIKSHPPTDERIHRIRGK
jgi:Zn-dependent protease with chaperone function